MPVAKSTLFKLIHKKMKTIILNGQYYVYWPDLREYIQSEIIPSMKSIIDADDLDIPSFNKDDKNDFLKNINVDARKLKRDLLSVYDEENPMKTLKILQKKKLDELMLVIDKMDDAFYNTYESYTFSLYLGNKHIYYTVPSIHIYTKDRVYTNAN